MTIEEKRRELFEAWASSVGLVIASRIGTHEYVMWETGDAWLAFNAALDAVVLPAREDDADGDRFSQGFNCALEEIQSTNLGLKVLP